MDLLLLGLQLRTVELHEADDAVKSWGGLQEKRDT